MMRMLGKCAASSCFKANATPLSGCTTSLQFGQQTSFCQRQPYQQCLKWSCRPKQCNGWSVMLTRLLKRNSQSLEHSWIDPVCLLGVSNGYAFMTGFFSCCLICDKSGSHWSAQFLLWKFSFLPMLPNLPLSTLTSCSLKESKESTGGGWLVGRAAAPRRVLTLTSSIAFFGSIWTVESLQCAHTAPAPHARKPSSTTGSWCKPATTQMFRKSEFLT